MSGHDVEDEPSLDSRVPMSPSHVNNDALLILDESVGGASLAISVNQLSPPGGPKAFTAIGLDEESGDEPFGFLETSDGDRVALRSVDPDILRMVVDMDVVVLVELDRAGVSAPFEYRIDTIRPNVPGMTA